MIIFDSRLPEMGEDDPKSNPFLKKDGFPDFANISIDKCLRRIGSQSQALEETVTKAEEFIKNVNDSGNQLSIDDFFENVMHPIAQADHELVATWGIAKTLFNANNVLFPTKNFISLHQRGRKANFARYKSKPIYETVLALKKAHAKTDELTVEQKRLLDMFELEGKLWGLNLTKEYDSDELEYTTLRLNQEMITFESKVYVAVDHFHHTITDYSLIQSFPPELVQAIAVDRKNPLNGPWKITLKPHILENFLTYCPDRELRWNIWRSNAQKASRQVITELDNGIHLESIRDHRNRIRELLGYASHNELMRDRLLLTGAEKPESVINELRSYAKPSQKQEIEKLNDFAIQNGFNAMHLHEYDVLYWHRKYNIAVCKYDENLIQEYFPIEKVFAGLFKLTEKWFNLKIVERNSKNVSQWHKNVKYYDVFDTNKSSLRGDSSEPIGGFFLDAFAVNDENISYSVPNGYVTPIREHCDRLNLKPLVSLIYNFQAPLYGKPHTLKLNEVEMLFSKFANTLQKILNESNYRELSGLINIEYVNDKVCSNVFSNLLYRSDVLKSISEHISTKEPLTDEHIRAIQAQRLTLAGYNLCTELFKSALDLELYTTSNFWLECLRKNYAKYSAFDLDKRDARILSMLDIVVGNWCGNYFGLVWSELMAADICEEFINDNDETKLGVGQRFRDTFLSSGSNTDSLELFRNFRGRDPAIEAYVSQLGLKQSKSQ